MLEEMRIRGLGVIDDAVLPLGPGLTVVTGETGAGKTMVLTGLGLLLGGRGDSALVRPGAPRALVEGRVLVDPDGPVARRALEAGADLDDDVLILARSIAPEGRSRAWVGGRAAPVALLGEIADDLVGVHGQSDQQRLLAPARQRSALDRYAGAPVTGPLARYAAAFARLRAVESDLETISGRARERAQEADLLRFGLDEIAAVDPRPGEEHDLAAEAGRLGHADALRLAATAAHAALLGDPDDTAGTARDAVTLLGAARREVERVSDHDPALAALAGRLAEAGYLIADVAADLASYAASVDTDPARLQAVHERQAALAGLLRKYGETTADVLAWAQQATTRLAQLDGDDDRLAALRDERAALRGQLAGLAENISGARAAAATRFAAAVTAELAGLAMPHARVEVAVSQREAGEAGEAQGGRGTGLRVGGRDVVFGPHGVDDVELRLAPHPGAPLLPLQRGASGGELSRVMLAVEVVFAGADPVPTFVFDEVDAGVGGRAAVEVGRRLARLARTAQVLVVTHLPQVAAFADRHLAVVKSDDGTVTRSGVTLLDDAGRVRELSRMLAGLEGSESATAHAEELLAAAATAKAPAPGPRSRRTPKKARAAAS